MRCPVCRGVLAHEALAVECARHLTGAPLCEVAHATGPSPAWDECGPQTRRRLVERLLGVHVEYRSDAYVRRHFRRAVVTVLAARVRAHVDSLPIRGAA